MHYHKIRFTSKRNGATAGLIIPTAKFSNMSIADISRLFPMSEASKMERIEQAGPFVTWNEAFAHKFND